MRRPFFRLLRIFVPVVLASAGCRDEEVPETLATTTAADSAGARYGFRAVDNLRVVPVDLQLAQLPRGWEGMRVAALSDLQLGLWPDNEAVARAAAERVAALRPDLVVLLGDYVARGGDYAALQRVLEPLRGTPTFAVLGNEDRLDDPDGTQVDSAALQTVQALRTSGVTVLINERGRFARGGDTAYIAGLDPYVARRPAWRQAEIYNSIPSAGQTPLLLSHMPAVLSGPLPERFPAVLAGHSICGPLEVPGTPRLAWLNTDVLPGAASPVTDRFRRVGGTALFVTCGLGFSFLPARFGGTPEIALITLRGPGSPALADTVGTASRDSLLNVFQAREDSVRRAASEGLPLQAPPDTAGT